MKHILQKDKLLATVEKIQKRIDARFPGAGLGSVADEVLQITRKALVRAEWISKPNRWLQGGLVAVFLTAITGAAVYLHGREDKTPLWLVLFQFLDATKGSAAALTALAIFLVTLETRLKRRRALQAIHELRSVAHVIDMHQLTKDPDLIENPTRPLDVAGRPMTADDMERYLHYCTELLAVVGKIGQLYVQDFPDSVAQTAVDHFESLATGLSSKIWQKLMILDRIRSNAIRNHEDKPAVEPATF